MNYKYQITPKFPDGSAVRLDHNKNSLKLGESLPFGKFAFGDAEPFIASGEKWYPVVEVNGVARTGWIAEIHNGQMFAIVTVNETVPPIDPNKSLSVTITVAPAGYDPQSTTFTFQPKP